MSGPDRPPSGTSARIRKILRLSLAATCAVVLTLALLADVMGLGGSPGMGGAQLAGLGLSALLIGVVAADRRGQVSARIALVTFGLVFAFATLEGGYRAWLCLHAPEDPQGSRYRVCSDVYVEFDQVHGERSKPNREHWMTYVENGRVVFGTTYALTNADGLKGKTSLDEYAERELKVLVVGDSMTSWNQMGVSWPDLLEQNLAHRLGRSVGVLNCAHRSYGVLQMASLAAAMARQHEPDLVIIAAISDDFTRNRWWSKTIAWQGFTRSMISSRSDRFRDYRCAVDRVLINPAADRLWCERMLAGEATADDLAVLDATNRQFAEIRDEVFKVRRSIDPWALDRSFIYSRIVGGAPFQLPPHALPRVTFDDFSADEELVSSIDALRSTNCALLQVYLPTESEIATATPAMSAREHNLMRSLERLTGHRFVLLHEESDLPAPEKMDLRPFTQHPNIDGLHWYADAVTPFAQACLQGNSFTCSR